MPDSPPTAFALHCITLPSNFLRDSFNLPGTFQFHYIARLELSMTLAICTHQIGTRRPLQLSF